jgi:predicted dienelactone hydrolase
MADQQEIHDVLAQMALEDASDESPVAGALDLDTLVLLGHSQGGLCALLAVEGSCELPCCVGLSFDRPEELAGAALWGTNRKVPLVPVPQTANDGIPLALLQGTVDSMAEPVDTQETYTKIQDPPKAYVGVIGANHYGMCDVNNPEGALADGSAPTLEQAVSVETIARWSAMFLRAHVLGDETAQTYVHEIGGPADENVNVVSEP